jgi:hypothetical protein
MISRNAPCLTTGSSFAIDGYGGAMNQSGLTATLEQDSSCDVFRQSPMGDRNWRTSFIHDSATVHKPNVGSEGRF